jgi:hypothetical protein
VAIRILVAPLKHTMLCREVAGRCKLTKKSCRL